MEKEKLLYFNPDTQVSHIAEELSCSFPTLDVVLSDSMNQLASNLAGNTRNCFVYLDGNILAHNNTSLDFGSCPNYTHVVFKIKKEDENTFRKKKGIDENEFWADRNSLEYYTYAWSLLNDATKSPIPPKNLISDRKRKINITAYNKKPSDLATIKNHVEQLYLEYLQDAIDNLADKEGKSHCGTHFVNGLSQLINNYFPSLSEKSQQSVLNHIDLKATGEKGKKGEHYFAVLYLDNKQYFSYLFDTGKLPKGVRVD